MSKIAIYPGSFNPWHQGHSDILHKALPLFDNIIIARGINPDKKPKAIIDNCDQDFIDDILKNVVCCPYAIINHYDTLLIDFVKEATKKYGKIDAIIRGLRNGSDLQYEMNMQYWNEDLGLDIPTVYFITDRKYCHISSSAIRQIEGFKK